MNAHCKHCGSEMKLADDRHETCCENPRPIPAFFHWLECSNLDCRSRGPRARTPEAASLGFLAIPDYFAAQ